MIFFFHQIWAEHIFLKCKFKLFVLFTIFQNFKSRLRNAIKITFSMLNTSALGLVSPWLYIAALCPRQNHTIWRPKMSVASVSLSNYSLHPFLSFNKTLRHMSSSNLSELITSNISLMRRIWFRIFFSTSKNWFSELQTWCWICISRYLKKKRINKIILIQIFRTLCTLSFFIEFYYKTTFFVCREELIEQSITWILPN